MKTKDTILSQRYILIHIDSHAQTSLNTMSDVNNLFEDVEFKVIFSKTDLKTAETLDLSSKNISFLK